VIDIDLHLTRGPRPGQQGLQHAVGACGVPGRVGGRLQRGVPGAQLLLPRRQVRQAEGLGQQVTAGASAAAEQQVLALLGITRKQLLHLHPHLRRLVLVPLILLDHLARDIGRGRVDVEDLVRAWGLGAAAGGGRLLAAMLLPVVLQQLGLAGVLPVAQLAVMGLGGHAPHCVGEGVGLGLRLARVDLPRPCGKVCPGVVLQDVALPLAA